MYVLIPVSRVYHREKRETILDKAKRRKLEVVLTTHETARVHIVSKTDSRVNLASVVLC